MQHLHVQLSYETAKIVVLKVLWQHIAGELCDVADNE